MPLFIEIENTVSLQITSDDVAIEIVQHPLQVSDLYCLAFSSSADAWDSHKREMWHILPCSLVVLNIRSSLCICGFSILLETLLKSAIKRKLGGLGCVIGEGDDIRAPKESRVGVCCDL